MWRGMGIMINLTLQNLKPYTKADKLLDNVVDGILTPSETAYLTAYNNSREALDHLRAHYEWYSTKHALDLIKIANRFNLGKVVQLQERLNWYGK